MTDHVGFERQRGIDTGRAGVARHAASDPGNTAFARELNGSLRRARHNQMAHAVVAVDKCRRRSGSVDGDVGPRIGRTEFQPLHILHQTEHAMCIGADEVRLQHELGDFYRVIFRHTGLAHRIDDQARNGSCWNACGLWRSERS